MKPAGRRVPQEGGDPVTGEPFRGGPGVARCPAGTVRQYGLEVVTALKAAWEASDRLLKPYWHQSQSTSHKLSDSMNSTGRARNRKLRDSHRLVDIFRPGLVLQGAAQGGERCQLGFDEPVTTPILTFLLNGKELGSLSLRERVGVG